MAWRTCSTWSPGRPGDGNVQITITFALGTDLDEAQVLVQNRVTIAEPQLPEEVRRRGITTKKNSPDLMMVIHLNSPDGSLDQLYISNYATLQIKDVLARLHGVGDIQVFGARDYSMRIWLSPERMAELDLTTTDVVNAVEGQNIQVASGSLNQLPVPDPGAFQLNIETLGRLQDVRQFENIIVKTDPDADPRVLDIARVELGAGTICATPISTTVPPRPWASSSSPAPTPWRPRPRSSGPWKSSEEGSRPASTTTSSTTRLIHPAVDR